MEEHLVISQTFVESAYVGSLLTESKEWGRGGIEEGWNVNMKASRDTWEWKKTDESRQDKAREG